MALTLFNTLLDFAFIESIFSSNFTIASLKSIIKITQILKLILNLIPFSIFQPLLPISFINYISISLRSKMIQHNSISFSLIFNKKPLINILHRYNLNTEPLFLALAYQTNLPASKIKLSIKIPDNIFCVI